MQDTDDNLLPNVAALRLADGTRLDSGFEWNRVLIHVDSEPGRACLHPERFHRSRMRQLEAHSIEPGI